MDDCSNSVVFIFTENPGVRGLSSTPALKGSNFYTVTYEIGESGEKHTVQVKNNKMEELWKQLLTTRQRMVTTCWTLPSTMTSTWMGLVHVKAPWPAPRVTWYSHRFVFFILWGVIRCVSFNSLRKILQRSRMKPQTKSWICWTLPLASLRSRALVARCEHEQCSLSMCIVYEHEYEQDVLLAWIYPPCSGVYDQSTWRGCC